MKKLITSIIIIFILIIAILGYQALINSNENKEVELIEITSKEELKKIYNKDLYEINTPLKLLTLPFSIFYEGTKGYSYYDYNSSSYRKLKWI